MVEIHHINVDKEQCSHCMKCIPVYTAQHEGLFNQRLARLEEYFIKGRLPETYSR